MRTRTEAQKAQRKVYAATPEAKNLIKFQKRRHYLKHRKSIIERTNKYYIEHREEVKARNFANRAVINAKRVQWNKDNPEIVRQYKRRHYYKHREEILKKTGEYSKRHPEKTREQARRWRKNNPEKRKQVVARYRRRNADKIRDRARPARRLYAQKNKEVLKQKRKEYIASNLAKVAASKADWRHRNREKIYEYNHRRLIRIGEDSRNPQIIEYVYSLRSSGDTKCCYCGTPLLGKEIHIDHIVPLSRGGKHELSNLCASCKPCNSSKHNKLLHEWKRGEGNLVV